MSKGKLLAGFAGAALPCLLAFAAAAQSDEVYSVFKTIPMQGNPLTSFDISFVDANINTFVLADRSNKSVDVVDTNSNVMTHQDRKSTRLNSSHQIISYAVFCLKKKKKN